MELVTKKYWKVHSECDNSMLQTMCFKGGSVCDYTRIHNMLTGRMSTLGQTKSLLEELRLMFEHLDRKSHEIIITKCSAPRCDHCNKFPAKAKKAWEFLKEREFKWFNPSLSTPHHGHFKTYLEMCEIDHEYFNTGDAGLPCPL